MKSGLSYLIAARQCEIGELERLAQTSELVDVISRFTHALQRERGIANIYLASRGARFGDQRAQQVAVCDALQREVGEFLDRVGTDPGSVRNGARLFSRIALVLHELEGLPALRSRVACHDVSPQQATEAFVRLVAGLLAVVFEAADSAGDPHISRALVALFNFMQGKEFAGQERALGAAVFASGHATPQAQRQWVHLVEQQQACLQVFSDFADPSAATAHAASEDERAMALIERLRHVGASMGAQDSPDAVLSQTWYDCCTGRIDAMRTVEDLLTKNLRSSCGQKIADAREELRDQQAIVEALHRQAGARSGGTTAPLGPQLERSVLDMVQEQSRRLQAMSDELDTVRVALNERKVIERAKGLLMAHQHLSEDEAFKAMRQMAMNQKRRLVEVAETVLAMAEMLPRTPR